MHLNLRPKRRPVPAIPIVSLIDIMLILLIFFVATTTFREKKVQMKINLPESKSMGSAESSPEVRKAITLTKTKELFLDGNPVEIEKLAEKMMPPAVHDYIAGGAADELTIRWNTEKYRDLRLQPNAIDRSVRWD